MAQKSQIYIPFLRWKMGEYQAVWRLTSFAHNLIMPIIAVPEQGFDFEKGENSKTLDDHLSQFTSRVEKKWGTTSECFIDMRYISCSELLADGRRAADFIFDDLKAKNIKFIPVTGLHETSSFEIALHNHIRSENHRLCLRVGLDEFGDNTFETEAEEFLHKLGLDLCDCDLILDLETINFDPIIVFSNLLTELMKNKPKLNQWKTFGILGTSFPKTMAGISKGISFLPRKEWTFYKTLIENLKQEDIRIPSFGDYAINHPEVQKIDPRILKPSANVRYTVNNKWLISRGQNVRDYRYSQFRELCQLIVDSTHYCGRQYSYGDDYIFKCARGTAKTGNLTTWREVGTNHHIEKVVQDLSNLVVS